MGYRFVVVAIVSGVLALTAGAAAASSGGTDPNSGGTRAASSNHHRVKLPRILRKIARCESGGDPRAVSPDGRFRGKFQFTRSTWRSVGGHGDPARAPEWLQDKLALKLYRQRGTSPWPNCA
jgi:hypothetical protein